MSQRELILMGTGGSVGVPAIGCDTPACLSDNPKNHRTRTGVFVPAPEGNFVIDTPPELRIQLTRERIPVVHAALFTHAHADHIFGLDDLRICGFRLGAAVQLYCEGLVEEKIRQTFSYAFDKSIEPSHQYAVPKFDFQRVSLEPFDLLGQRIQPIRFLHGRLPILGFRINEVAFCTDVSEIPEESWPLLENLDVLVIGALRHSPHPTHFNIAQALEVIEIVKPGRAVLTHISGELEHEETNSQLPEGVELAFDRMRIPF
ncbi:MBL fold metallo-hydrolase [Calycomorphotria hydatis]|uniref:Phosphoribosyl 1,2-cyclic phosphodiesterase n=1 Tax=Calycomorphotria hydatis TaxID=2528027 RepID=A0A517T9I9_9PLAN|nr:MBL fold metallo-hydrolase [Calycomorphotria hydatis]QDT65044.1 Phosphoribosyl 1,2-cyclic phosphodiesterase [Calycomorphotria hydatis]